MLRREGDGRGLSLFNSFERAKSCSHVDAYRLYGNRNAKLFYLREKEFGAAAGGSDGSGRRAAATDSVPADASSSRLQVAACHDVVQKQ